MTKYELFSHYKGEIYMYFVKLMINKLQCFKDISQCGNYNNHLLNGSQLTLTVKIVKKKISKITVSF